MRAGCGGGMAGHGGGDGVGVRGVGCGVARAAGCGGGAGAARREAGGRGAGCGLVGGQQRGELGNGTLTGSDVPGRVSGLSGVRAVAAGGRHELAVLSGGTVLAWGDDTFGQLGNGIASANGDTEVPAAVPGLSGVTAVAAGEEHSLALLSDGTVMAWGENRYGQLGSGSTAQRGAGPGQGADRGEGDRGRGAVQSGAAEQRHGDVVGA